MMQRTQWKGLGDGDAGSGSFDPGDPSGNVVGDDLAQLIAANNARVAGGTNVDPITALQSKIGAMIPPGTGLPLAIAGFGLLALLLTPSSGGRRR